MRFLALLYLFIFNQVVSATNSEAVEAVEAVESVEAFEKPSFVDLDVTYEILERPSINFDTPTEFITKETATLNITFKNNEDSNITVVGLSGSLVDAMLGYEVANVTAQELGPFHVAVNESVVFQAPIQLTLPEGSYLLAPILFVVKGDEMMKVGIRPLSIFISPPPLSFFSPSFLSVQILLGLIVAGLTYLVVNSKKQDNRSSKKRAVEARPIDDSWLPSVHKKLK